MYRKNLLMMLDKAQGHSTFKKYYFLKLWGTKPENEIKHEQVRRLIKILQHAYDTTEYYKTLFNRFHIVENGNVDVNRFTDIPVLTRELLKSNLKSLISNCSSKRTLYWNRSGGSTGVPVEFLQDKEYKEWARAKKFLFDDWSGREIGDKQIQLWGSERDLFLGNIGLKAKLSNIINNRVLLNSFKMNLEQMMEYVDIINKEKPVQILGYSDSLHEFANFIKRENLKIWSPKTIMTSAGTLYPYMRDIIEEVFSAPVYNRYGCREFSDIACQCNKRKGLHISSLTEYIEVVRPDGSSCEIGEEGDILVTSLTNYVMPLVRYKIGDTGILGNSCNCGINLPLLREVTGRSVEIIKKKDGSTVSPLYFIHLLGVVLKNINITKFQVIQENYDLIRILIVTDKEVNDIMKKEITDKIRIAMGSIKVIFENVNDIPQNKSGKYCYVISKV